jgi:Tat protein translocase TatB subunit
MFDGRLSEFLLIALIAIVVVGPKDLPKVMVKLGRWTRAAQRAAREFQHSLEQLAEEAEAKDVARDLRKLGEDAKAGLSGERAAYPAETDPTGPANPPPLSVLPPEGGSFRPPSEEDERTVKTGSKA